MTTSGEQFISEPIIPVPGCMDTSGMAIGEPGLPSQFTWRKTQYTVTRLLEKSKSSGPCRSGSSEIYLRRHWYKVETDPHCIMNLYCERQPRSAKQAKSRWFVYSIEL